MTDEQIERKLRGLTTAVAAIADAQAASIRAMVAAQPLIPQDTRQQLEDAAQTIEAAAKQIRESV